MDENAKEFAARFRALPSQSSTNNLASPPIFANRFPGQRQPISPGISHVAPASLCLQ
jgi:hypothetical protein